jgi:hypothetical protein
VNLDPSQTGCPLAAVADGSTGPFLICRKITSATWPGHGRVPRHRNRAVRVAGAACALLFNGSTPMTKQATMAAHDRPTWRPASFGGGGSALPRRVRQADDRGVRGYRPRSERKHPPQDQHASCHHGNAESRAVGSSDQTRAHIGTHVQLLRSTSGQVNARFVTKVARLSNEIG